MSNTDKDVTHVDKSNDVVYSSEVINGVEVDWLLSPKSWYEKYQDKDENGQVVTKTREVIDGYVTIPRLKPRDRNLDSFRFVFGDPACIEMLEERINAIASAKKVRKQKVILTITDFINHGRRLRSGSKIVSDTINSVMRNKNVPRENRLHILDMIDAGTPELDIFMYVENEGLDKVGFAE